MKLSTLAKVCLGIVAFSLPIAIGANMAEAAATCGTHEKITSTLASEYNEVPLHRGLTPKGTMVEVFASKKGTFTVVVTIPSGMSCLVTAGTHWQEVSAASIKNPTKPEQQGKVF